jgi:signal transduction histidine kinase
MEQTASLARAPEMQSGEAGQPLLTTRKVLAVGFGVLLLLLLLSGVNAVHILSELQNNNESTLRAFLARERQLEEIRSAVYLSGTYIRDYLLEPNSGKAEQSRLALAGEEGQIKSLLSANGPLSASADQKMFEDLERQTRDYWRTLEPVMSWNTAERHRNGYRFLRDEVFPRRSTTLNIADTIASVNEQQLMERDEHLVAKFVSLRTELMFALGVMLILGALQAYFSTAHILNLERKTFAHLRAVTEARQELRALSAKLVTTQEDERKNLSRELHDAVGQSLSAIQLELHEMAVVLGPSAESLRRRVNFIRELVEGSLAMVRNMALLLRPSMLDDIGLAAALEWQAREISRLTGMRIQVMADDLPSKLPDEHKITIFRIVQEALNNVCKHANATAVQIAVVASDPWLVLTVQDDGRGFRTGRAKGLGLAGMQERAENLGGTLRITSDPGKGTVVEAALPLPDAVGADSDHRRRRDRPLPADA